MIIKEIKSIFGLDVKNLSVDAPMLRASNLWYVSREGARKIQYLYNKGEDLFAIFAAPETEGGLEALAITKDGEEYLDKKIIDLSEYIATSDYEFETERAAIDYLVKNYDEYVAARWKIKD